MQKYISDSCIDYIQHSLDHPDRAITILNNWLLDKEQKDYLTDNEYKWTIFFLYASLYLYDIGLSSPPLSKDTQSSQSSLSQLLKLRAKRGKLIVKSYWEEIGIENETQAQWIAKIFEYQELNFDNPQLKQTMQYGVSGERVNLLFIVSCLKITYELDLTPSERVPFLFERFLPNASSVVANNFYFWGINPRKNNKEEYTNEIYASLDCYDIETHRAFKQNEGFLQIILNEVNRNLTPRFKYTEIVYEIENHNYEPIDFKFKVETSAALEIFKGIPIYTQKATFLRELIQNSIDACEVRSISNPSYQPKISVERKPGFKTVVVKDNGIGMDKNTVEKYFLPIGISFYRSEEFENIRSLDVGFSPISRFGIGILSCFMVAEKIVVRTKKQGSDGLEMTIADFRNYFVVRQDNSLEQGTEIVVTLKPDYTDIDCLNFLHENIKCTKYPIEYIYFNGERKEIAQEPVSLVSKLQQKFWSDEWKNYIEERIPLSSPNSEGYIAFNISYATADSSIDETYIDDSSVDETYIDDSSVDEAYIDEVYTGEADFHSGYMSVCNVYVFQDGIYICNEPRLLPEWITRNIICRINLLDEDRLDLAISRSGLILNSKYFSLQQILNGSLVLLFSKVFEGLKSQYQERADYQTSLKMIVEQNFKIVDDEALIKLLKDFYCFTLLTSDRQVLGYYFYDELPQFEKKIVIFMDKKRFIEKNIQLYKTENRYFIVGPDGRIIHLIDKMGRYERVEQRLRMMNLLQKQRGIPAEMIPHELLDNLPHININDKDEN